MDDRQVIADTLYHGSKVFCLFVGAVLLALLMHGCDSPTPRDAQEVVTAGAEVVQDFDEELAPLVAMHVDRCDESHETREAFLECVEPITPIRYGIGLSRRSLRLAQAAIDAWVAGESDGWSAFLPIAACIAHGIDLVVESVRLFDLDAPIDDALAWVDSFGSYAALACPGAEFPREEP